MSEDLISGNFVENINQSIVKKNIRLISIILILVGIYSLLDFIDWYSIILKYTGAYTSERLFFFYRVRPIIAFTGLSISFINGFFILRANKLIDKSLELKDPDFFNKAYSLFCRISILTIISYCLAIISIAARFIFK